MSDLTLLADADDDDEGTHGYAREAENNLYDEAVGPRRMTRFRTPGEWSDAP
jgi:hypothetical protein